MLKEINLQIDTICSDHGSRSFSPRLDNPIALASGTTPATNCKGHIIEQVVDLMSHKEKGEDHDAPQSCSKAYPQSFQHLSESNTSKGFTISWAYHFGDQGFNM